MSRLYLVFAGLLLGCSLLEPEPEPPVPALSLTIRVATLHLDQRADWIRRRPLLEAGLARIDADIVAFQDVLSFPDASDQVAWIHRRLGFQVRFQETGLPFGAARTGMVLASRFKIIETSALQIDADEHPLTLVQSALVRTPLGTLAIHNVHLPADPSPPDFPTEAIDRIRTHVAGIQSDLAPILLGDFGLPPDDPAMERLTTTAATGTTPFFDAWRATHGYEAGPTVGLSETPTYDSPQRARRVDQILLARTPHTRPGLPVSAERFCHTPDLFGTWPGTHCGVVATLRYR